jgi:hypothetical protein
MGAPAAPKLGIAGDSFGFLLMRSEMAMLYCKGKRE